MFDWAVDAKQLTEYIRSMNSFHRKGMRTAGKWVKRFTKYTHRRMQIYSKFKTNRSTGRLSSSIRSEYRVSGGHLSGRVFVPQHIKYQFAAEYGINKRFVIYGKPLMAFEQSSWKKARRGSSVISSGKQSFYIFPRVRRGRYKGKRFVEKSFNDLLKHYGTNAQKVVSELGRDLVFGRSS